MPATYYLCYMSDNKIETKPLNTNLPIETKQMLGLLKTPTEKTETAVIIALIHAEFKRRKLAIPTPE